MSICTACGQPYTLRWTEPDENGLRNPLLHCPVGGAMTEIDRIIGELHSAWGSRNNRSAKANIEALYELTERLAYEVKSVRAAVSMRGDS